MAPEVRSTHSSSPDIVSATLDLGLLGLDSHRPGLARDIQARRPNARWLTSSQMETLCFAWYLNCWHKHKHSFSRPPTRMKRSRHPDGPTTFRATWGGKQHVEKTIPTAKLPLRFYCYEVTHTHTQHIKTLPWHFPDLFP